MKTSFGVVPSWSTENVIARVIRVDRGIYRIIIGDKVCKAVLKGNVCSSPESYPTVGDWVEVDNIEQGPRIIQVMPRKNLLYRMIAGGRKDLQVIASNLNKVYICSSANNDFNIRRIERYAYMASMCKIPYEVIITKMDLSNNQKKIMKELQSTFPNIKVHKVSIYDTCSVEKFEKTLEEGDTIALVGSSGVGKSSLINHLSGSKLLTNGLRNDDKGRHTTTHREVIPIGRSRVIIDTPGMRELNLYADDEAIDDIFDDIALLSQQCKFRDCQHQSEPGCAVKEAMESGELDPKRFKNYLKLKRQFKRSNIRRKGH